MQHTTVITSAALALLSGNALAAFDARSVDCGSLGSGITASADFYQSNAPGAGNRPPSPEAIEGSGPNNYAQYDSYVAIDIGPSVGGDPGIKGDGFGANPNDISFIGNPFAIPNRVGGVWFMDPASARPEVSAVPNTFFGGANAIFIARLTFRSLTGAAPSETLAINLPGGVVIDIRDPGTIGVGSPATDSLLVRFAAFNTTVQTGLDGGSLTNHPTANQYQLREVVSTAGPLPGGSAIWQVHDLYVVEMNIPTPGIPGVGLMATSFLWRRRRS